jgi:WS/DGAT/MGAT family acyltransferase
LFVLHHAVADGLRGVALLGALLDATPTPETDVGSWSPSPPPARATRMLDATRMHLREAAALGRDVLRLPRDLARTWPATRAMLAATRGRVTRTELAREVGPTRRLIVIQRPLAPLREVGHRHGTTLNDVILAAVTRGLRDWLRARGLDPDDATVRVSVPVGARGNNETGILLVPLPVSIDDRAARLANVAQTTRTAKATYANGTGPRWNLPALPRSLARAWIRWFRTHGNARITAYVTNVPGPPAPLFLGDARLLSAVPIGPVFAGVALSVAVFSYAGALSIGVHLDGEVPDAEILADGIARELDAWV